MKQNWEKEIRIILGEQVVNYTGLFDEATCCSEIQELINQAKQEKDKEYADFSKKMNKALFETENQDKQEERERILKNIGQLRQWLNERTEDGLITNKDIETFLNK